VWSEVWRVRGWSLRAQARTTEGGSSTRSGGGGGGARASASACSGAWHDIEHEAAQRVVKFKRGMAPNLRDYGHDPIERSLHLTFLCHLCVEAYGFC
jgi:hypothetical protein